MVTIKTKESGEVRHIITKTVSGQRRVSCSCCEEIACCMYPAQALLDGLYTWDDLPEEIQLPFGFIDLQMTLTRISPRPIGGGFVYYENATEQSGYEAGDVIIFAGAFEGWTIDLAGSITGVLCLIDDFFVKDNFEDTYTVTTPFSSGTVTRQTLCIWDGVDGNGCPLQLLYGGFGSDPETEPAEGGLKWSVSFNKFESPEEEQPEICTVSYGRLKSGFQNSPTGTYDITYATEGPEVATVS